LNKSLIYDIAHNSSTRTEYRFPSFEQRVVLSVLGADKVPAIKVASSGLNFLADLD